MVLFLSRPPTTISWLCIVSRTRSYDLPGYLRADLSPAIHRYPSSKCYRVLAAWYNRLLPSLSRKDWLSRWQPVKIERLNKFKIAKVQEQRDFAKIVTYDTSPAPKNTNLFSDIFFLVIRFDAKIPATATAAVPCISSLNVQYLSRYLSKKRKALWFPKSSNWKGTVQRWVNKIYCYDKKKKKGIDKYNKKKRTWMRTFWPYFFTQAAINSSINSSYSAPWLLALLRPM